MVLGVVDPKFLDLKSEDEWMVTVGVSRAHVHLSAEHVEALFGPGHTLTVLRELGQEGQFAAKECVNVVGPKGVLQQVRIIGPIRPQTQVEVSRTDTFTLGIDAPIRDSGKLLGTPGAVLTGPKGIVVLDQGVIIARAHIHLLADKAQKLEIMDGDKVSVLIKGEKSVWYHDVLVRLVTGGMTEFHIDTDEANAAFVDTGDLAMIQHRPIICKDRYGNVLNVNVENVKFIQGKVPHDYYSQEGIRLLRTVFEDSSDDQRRIVEKMLNPETLAPNKFYLFTALENDKVIGIACFYYMPGINVAYLEHIGIMPEFRKRGIGSFFFHKILSFLEKNHPEIAGVLLEVRQTKEGLDDRKQFFLNSGAIPVATDFYPSERLKLGQVMLMFKPETADARLTTVVMEMALQTLSKIL